MSSTEGFSEKQTKKNGETRVPILVIAEGFALRCCDTSARWRATAVCAGATSRGLRGNPERVTEIARWARCGSVRRRARQREHADVGIFGADLGKHHRIALGRDAEVDVLERDVEPLELALLAGRGIEIAQHHRLHLDAGQVPDVSVDDAPA